MSRETFEEDADILQALWTNLFPPSRLYYIYSNWDTACSSLPPNSEAKTDPHVHVNEVVQIVLRFTQSKTKTNCIYYVYIIMYYILVLL